MTIIAERNENKQTGDRYGTTYHCGGSLLVIKETCLCVPKLFVNSSRGRCLEFTAGAARRMRRYLRECVSEYGYMVTLTYPGFHSTDGAETKEHLRRFLQECRRHVERSDSATRYSIFWFLEFQARGAPHYHLFTSNRFEQQWIASTWYRIVNSEDPRHLAAGTRTEKLRAGRSGTISYANKYAAKQEQKTVPEGFENVGRFWGVSGDRGTMAADTWVPANGGKARKEVNTIKNTINKVICDGVLAGTVEIYKREYGVLICVLHSAEIARRIRMRISQLSAVTGYLPQIFQDAEIEV